MEIFDRKLSIKWDHMGYGMEPIAEFLYMQLKEYVDGRHSKNISKASHVLKIEYSTIYRLYHGKLNNVPFFPAYEILKKLFPEDFLSILTDYFPGEMHKVYEIAGSTGDPLEELDQRLTCAFESSMAFKIFVRCQSPTGFTVLNVRDEFGSDGLSLLDRMVALGLIVINEDLISTSLIGKDLNPSEKHLKAHGFRTLEHLDLAQSATYIASRYHFLNEMGFAKVYHILEQTMDALDKLAEDPAFRGERPLLLTLAGGPLFKGVQQ